MSRKRLPNRSDGETVTTTNNNRNINISIGRALDGRVLEVFARSGKPDSDFDRIVDDAAVIVSRLLQYGDTLAAIATGIGRLPDGSPSSVLGAIIDAAFG